MSPYLHSNLKLRCMEHSLHLAAKHFVQTITPASSKKHASDTDSEGGAASDGEADGDGDDDDQGFDSGDSLAKAIALDKQVSCPVFYQRIYCINTYLLPTDS